MTSGTEEKDEASRRESQPPALPPPSPFPPSAFCIYIPGRQQSASNCHPSRQLPQTGKNVKTGGGEGAAKKGEATDRGRSPPSFKYRHLARSLVVRNGGGCVCRQTLGAPVVEKTSFAQPVCLMKNQNSGWDIVSPERWAWVSRKGQGGVRQACYLSRWEGQAKRL